MTDLRTFKMLNREWNKLGVNVDPEQPGYKTAADIIEKYEKSIDDISPAFA